MEICSLKLKNNGVIACDNFFSVRFFSGAFVMKKADWLISMEKCEMPARRCRHDKATICDVQEVGNKHP